MTFKIMRLSFVDFSVSLCLLTSVAISVKGKPFQDVSSVHELSGQNLTLPCNINQSDSLQITVEWMWKDKDKELVVVAVRHNVELVMEKDLKYVNRSSALKDGTLKLVGITKQDAGVYRCIRRSKYTKKDLLVDVTVCESSTVDMGVLRSAENDLLVTCESTGWLPKTQISMLDHLENVFPGQMEETVGPDGCLSVRVSQNLQTQDFRNGTIVCRVTSRESTVVKTNKLALIDGLKVHEQSGADHHMFFTTILPLGVVFFMIMFLLWKKPLYFKEHFIEFMNNRGIFHEEDLADERERLLDDVEEGYQDISDISTTGASLETSLMKRLCTKEEPWVGVPVSERLAELDLANMGNFKSAILHVGRDDVLQEQQIQGVKINYDLDCSANWEGKYSRDTGSEALKLRWNMNLKVAPCLIAGMISRQSNAGTQLRPDGFGSSDGDSFGLLQVNRYYQAVSRDPCSQDHIRQGMAFLIQVIKKMWRERPKWNRDQWLKGALAGYISGEDRILALKPSEDVDSITPCGDFANDVIARAHFYARNGY